MNMENQVTSIEQSKRLLELGIKADNASMWWERYAGVPEIEDRFKSAWHIVVDKDAHHADHYEYVPAFTVVDLFDIIGEPEGYTFYVTIKDGGRRPRAADGARRTMIRLDGDTFTKLNSSV